MKRDRSTSPGKDAKEVATIVSSFWKVRLLHQASVKPAANGWSRNRMRGPGDAISPSRLPRMLRGLERRGWLKSKIAAGEGRKSLRQYSLTSAGRRVLALAQERLRELVGQWRTPGVRREEKPARGGRHAESRQGLTGADG